MQCTSHLEPLLTISAYGLMEELFAWHTMTLSSSGAPIYYAANPDQDGCCGSGVNSLFAVSSHELAETVTDPNVSNGWYDANGEEIGDKCNGISSTVGADGTVYAVEPIWSNAAGKCVSGVSSPPAAPPVAPPVAPPTSSKLGDWAVCSTSSQCNNNCCTSKYSGGILKCTPLGSGFNPAANGCVGGGSGQLGDWASCTSSSQCMNQCCSSKYSGGVYKCTPLAPGPTVNGCNYWMDDISGMMNKGRWHHWRAAH